MKKIFIAVLAVVALVSCSKEQTVNVDKGEAISFENAFVENATRATDLTTTNLQDFGVYGTVAKGDNTALIFDNTKVYKNGDVFKYDTPQYWIAAAQYYFTAIAPYSNAKWSYATTTAHTGTISFDNAAALASQDLLFAAASKTTTDPITDPGKVGFTFNHVLSRVAFTFTNSFAEKSNITLKVHNVAITNTAANGTLPVTASATGTWTNTDDYAINFGAQTLDAAPELAENGGNNTTEHFYLIPAKRTYNITFQVTMFQAGVQGQTFTHSIDKEIDFAKGGNYSLNIALEPETVNPEAQLYPIEFTVTDVTEWTNSATGVEVEIPANN